MWALTLSKLSRDRAALTDNAIRQASSLSKTYAEQLTRSLEQIDQVTLHLKHYWRVTHGLVNLEKQMQEGLFPVSAHLYVTIVDRNGWVATSTLDSSGSQNISGRDYFQFHKSGLAGGLLISEPALGRRYGKTVIRFSRRLDTADGSFDGIVLVAVEPIYLASFTDESGLGKSDFLSVGRSDGSFLASKMGAGIRSMENVFRTPPVFGSDKDVVAMKRENFIDDQARIVAWQKLKNYPLVSTVGISEEGIQASYKERAKYYWSLAIAGSVLLLLLAASGIVVTTRLAWRKRQTEKIERTYRLATDGAREGFYIVRTLYDEEERVVDFLVEDCNERGATYYGMLRTQLIGKKFSEMPFGSYLSEVVRIFSGAMQTGFYEDELKVPAESPLQVAWVHRRLVRSGDGLAVTLRDISDMKAHEEALSRLANMDAVTALPNRHWLMNHLPTAVMRARESGATLAMLFVDLDDFKNINDTMGHAAGDELLRAAAARLRSVIRPQDNVVRLGGDEFTVILERVESSSDAARVAERIISSLDTPFVLADASLHAVKASIGISMFPHDGGDGETLLKHADIAMYAAKANGKGQYEFYRPQLSERLVVRLDREQALRKAIELDEFVLFYQPRVDTFTGELRSLEALVRWMHPERGLVPPQEFIPMAEETGLIVQLGELVIRKACAQLAQWRRQHLPVVPVSINVSPRQFNEGNLSALFSACMSEQDIAPSLIEIEITESCMIGEGNAVNEELSAIEALGIKLLVDDFGTGYSSLSHLQRLDFDILKVDRAFTAQLCNGKEGEAFFMAILSMAHVLGMGVVAEGVETAEQLHVLQALSCNEVQGYFISRPVPASEVPDFFARRYLFHAEHRSPLHAV
ncbi:EAL domain-containing protein [Noviherbaspirillum cavernae]|uniref:EAL domain-containing protein n=1 Tax=Noviherbaspirillum cavernae TaxID=2320862 RepID=A0A418X6A9_9BURK|nr:EAL domain-containing protein [Noviherbaspirillum cavernae]